MKNNTVAIIQGRMGSSRLPGKVLLDIAGKPMLQHVIERAREAQTLNSVIVATSNDPADDPIPAFCNELGIPCARGSLHDVLDRYYQAACAHNAGTIVRITADCPLLDPALVDSAVESLVSGAYDFVANRLPPPFTRSFPIGLDVEVCTFAALKRAWTESTETFHREHVMPYIYQDVALAPQNTLISTGTSPRGFKIALLNHEPNHGALRWTVDTSEDLAFVREIFLRLKAKPQFTWYDVLDILAKEPQLASINSEIRHKNMTEVDERAKI